MCGFAGILKPPGSAVDAPTLWEMAATIRHRGPDDSQIALVSTSGRTSEREPPNLGLAFQRLAIIDTSDAGRQPMFSRDGSRCLVYNGEVYNYPELKADLSRDPSTYCGGSDTEIVLQALEERGDAAFGAFNGMFALAYWDAHAQRLTLARDRMGIKPLYYTMVGGSLVFASEIKCIFRLAGTQRGLDLRSVIEYFSFQYCLGERTWFEGIYKVPPGCALEFDCGVPDRVVRVHRFWSPQFDPDPKVSLHDCAEGVRAVMARAVARQTRSDVTVSSFLSSGMDTGAITALAVPHVAGLQTFTCGFNVEGAEGLEVFNDERSDARVLARELDSRHFEIGLDHDALARLAARCVWHMEEPHVGISYQILATADLVRRHATVILSGVGGDELFGGYPWRYNPIINAHDTAVFDEIYYEICCRLLPSSARWSFFSDRIARDSGRFDPRDSYDDVMREAPVDELLHRALYFDMRGFLRGILLVDDKLNMASSVEARVPLLDNEVVDLCLRMPSKHKFDGHVAKKALKEAVRGILPAATIDRRKQGFTPPDDYWMRTHSRRYMERMLLCDRFLDRDWFQPEAVRRSVTEHMSGKRNHRFFLWALLCFDLVNRLFLEGETLDTIRNEG